MLLSRQSVCSHYTHAHNNLDDNPELTLSGSGLV